MGADVWEEHSAESYEDFWERVDVKFAFRPRYTVPGPAIVEPTPSVTFDLSPLFANTGPVFAAGQAAVNALALLAMVQAFPPAQRLVVLDWQHKPLVLAAPARRL